MSYDHVYNFKRKHLSEPPFGILREEIFASEEQENKINLKRHHMVYLGSSSRQTKLTYSGKIGRPFGHYRNVKKICTSMSYLICCNPISPYFCHYETKADLNLQQLKHFGLPLRTLEIVFPMTYISKFLGGGGGGMPPDPSNKERLRRSVVNRASKTTLGTPLCKKAGYAPDLCIK